MLLGEVVCKELVVTNLLRRGDGVKHSPIRVITQVFEKDGTLVAENDPSPETFALMDLVHFARWCNGKFKNNDSITKEQVIKWLDKIETSNPQ